MIGKHLICAVLLITILIVACAHETNEWRITLSIREDWNKQEVIKWLDGARTSHIRNRGVGNSPEFDDWCVTNYERIIEWIEKNTE